jgi:hypothetical protein
MVLNSYSSTSVANPDLRADEPKRSGGNKKWLAEVGDGDGVILIGGTSLADFRVRVAQSSLRGDMLPSFWSQAGILLGGGMFASVPLDLDARSTEPATRRNDDVSAIPRMNAVRLCSLDEIDSPRRFPNLAVIRFAEAHDNVRDHIKRIGGDHEKGTPGNRAIVDLPAMMLPWLAFIWGTTGSSNPLLHGMGLPSSAFVETVFAMAGFELTPGLSSASSCPEAIWQAAKWWTEFYESAAASDAMAKKTDAIAMVPKGAYIIRQASAAVEWPEATKKSSGSPSPR